MAALLDSFSAWTDKVTVDIMQVFAPGIEEPATKGWALTRLDHCLYVLAGYLVIVAIGLVKKAGAKAQKQQKKDKKKPRLTIAQAFAAEPIKVFQLIYNATQVALCGYMIVGAINEARAQGYGLICNPFRPAEKGMAYFLWVFYVSKVLDFIDTLFMVVRGNYRQISFLHVYHHISIYLVYWLNVNAGYDGDIYFTIVANGAVHFVMYFYYFLTTLQFRPSWKMLVTVMQLVQFLCMNAQAIYILKNDCPFPRNITMFYLFYIISLFVLFMNFFLQSYCKKGKGGKGKGGKGEKQE